MEPYQIIKFPVATEKSMRLMEMENKLVFVVDRKATKKDIKDAISDMFKVQVEEVNTLVSVHGEKMAYVKFSRKNPAIDIATKMGLM